MIGVDTNVLVRYLTQDDPDQSPRATALIEDRLTADQPGFVNIVVVVETVWVLRRAYGYSRLEAAAEVERLLQIDSLVLSHEAEVFTAAMLMKADRGEFADALVLALNGRAGCDETLTFDPDGSRALRCSEG